MRVLNTPHPMHGCPTRAPMGRPHNLPRRHVVLRATADTPPQPPKQEPPEKQPATPPPNPNPPPPPPPPPVDPSTSRRAALMVGTAAIVGSQIATSPVLNFGKPALFSPIALPRLDSFVTGQANADSEDVFRNMPQVPHVRIAEGLYVSQVIKGCMQLSGISHRGARATDNTKGDAAIADLRRFAAAGITTLDTADTFGDSETQIGRYLQLTPNAKDTTQVMTKLSFFGFNEVSSASSRQYVEQKVRERCARLGIDKLDLVQLYWNNYDVNNYTPVALHLMDLRAKGLIGNLGACNFDTVRLQQMKDAGVTFATSQVQYSMMDRRAEALMAPYCLRNNIAMIPYGVLAGGFLSDKYLRYPEGRINYDTYSKHRYKRIIDEVGGWPFHQRTVNVLADIADKHQTSVANIAARWVLNHPAVPAVIIGARNANHLMDHQQLARIKLDDDDIGHIEEVLLEGRRIRGDVYNFERKDWAIES